MVTLAQFGLMTGFLLGPVDDRRVSPSLLPQKHMGNLCCQYTGCARRRHPGLQSNAENIQGMLGEGTLVSWFGVLLVMVTKMNVLMCFRADILLEIPRVHASK